MIIENLSINLKGVLLVNKNLKKVLIKEQQLKVSVLFFSKSWWESHEVGLLKLARLSGPEFVTQKFESSRAWTFVKGVLKSLRRG